MENGSRRRGFPIGNLSACGLCAALILCCGLVSPAAEPVPARGFDAAVAENPAACAGLLTRYAFDGAADTPPPDGYSPFYISHYGRHGCRYLTNDSELSAVCPMEKAAEAGALTDRGLELLKSLRKIKAAHEGMMGGLTVRGAREHRQLSRRMHERFRRIFSAAGKVQCQSSTYPRCLVSMANFACELKGLEPRLEFDFATGDRYMSTMLNRPKGSEFSSAMSKDAERRLLESVFDPGPMMCRLFGSEPAAGRFVKDPYAFGQSLFYMAGSCNTLDAELDGLAIYDKFTTGELVGLFRAMHGRWYIRMGNSAELGDGQIALAGNLGADFARRAESAIAGSGVVADLRFGHDSGLWPFVGHLGLEGAGDRVPFSKVCDHDVLWKCMTMAANIQMVFFRNAAGDVLVKVLYNERESRIRGLEPVEGPYYSWKDVKERLIRGEFGRGG